MWKIILITICSIIVIIVLLLYLGSLSFNRKVKDEVNSLFYKAPKNKSEIITEEDIKGLPTPVQKYLRYTGIIGKEKIYSVRLKQRGFVRLENRPWMPFIADQYYTINPPAFIWTVNMKAFPFLSIRGRDIYSEGRGNMLIKIPPITIANAIGNEMDQGTITRFLNEIMWFPSGYLSDYIKWESIDSTSAKATMIYQGLSVSAILDFNDKGELTNFIAQRYMAVANGYKLETWSTPITEYSEINGFKLPVKGEGIWKLSSGDYSYIKLELIHIEYNNPSPY